MPAAAAMAPSTAVGWKPALCTSLGATRLSRHSGLDADGDANERGRAVRIVPLAGREHSGQDHRTGMHRPALERVVEILAVHGSAIDEGGARSTQRARVPDGSAGSVIVPSRERGLDVVLVAGRDGEPDDVEGEVLALVRTAAGSSAESSATMRSASRSATESA